MDIENNIYNDELNEDDIHFIIVHLRETDILNIDLKLLTDNDIKLVLKNKKLSELPENIKLAIIKNREQQRPFVNKMIRTEKLVVYIIFTFIPIRHVCSIAKIYK